MTEREVIVDGIRLHVREAGAGPALVMLHGLGANGANFDATAAAFADRWRVIVPDLPGHGRSAKPDAPYTVDFFAGVIRSLGRTLGISEAIVMGNSLGGLVAIELALGYAGWTRGLVLAAPATGFPAVFGFAGRALGAAVRPGLLRTFLPIFHDRSFYDPTLAASRERRALLEERLADEDFPGFARAVARSLEGVLSGGRPPLERLRQPTLLVWGRQDRLVPLGRSARLVRELPQARLTVLDRCGHVPMVEQPIAFNRAVAEFLPCVDAAPRPRRAAGAS